MITDIYTSNSIIKIQEMEAVQKREIIVSILKGADFQTLPKQFHHAIMILLDINDFKQLNPANVAQKIILIYENHKNNNLEKYFMQKKFNNVHCELKEYLWNIFKKYHEQVCARRQSTNRNQYHPPTQEMNMNMFNMFLNVPNFQSIDEIQYFQRKMYDVCKRSMPQVLHSLTVPSKQMSSFRPNNLRNNMGPINFQGASQYDFQSPGFSPYYRSSGGNFLPMKQPIDNDMRNYSSRNYYREQIPHEQYRNPSQSRSIYSHQHIPSPSENQRNAFLSQQNLQYDHQSRSAKLPNQGFTLYQSKNILKIPKIIHRGIPHSFDEQQSYKEPRKLVKRDLPEETGENHDIFKCKCKQNQTKKCDYCRISTLGLFNVPETILKWISITKHLPQTREVQVDQKLLQKITKDNDNYEIEVRSVRSNSDYYGNQWPQELIIKINNQEIYKTNKKQSAPLLISKHINGNEESCSISISTKQNDDRSDDNDRYIMMVVLVKKLAIQKVFEQIKKKMKSVEASQIIDELKDKDDGNKVTIKPIDKLTKQLIDDPVRGSLCKHAQCFDLKTYLQYHKFTQNSQFNCPICKEPCREFVFDKQIKQILENVKKMIKEPNKVMIYKSGGYKYIYEEQKNREENGPEQAAKDDHNNEDEPKQHGEGESILKPIPENNINQ